MERTLLRIGIHLFPPELSKLELVPEERPRNIDVFRSDADDFLPIENFFCKRGGQAPQEMPAAVNHDFCFEGHWPGAMERYDNRNPTLTLDGFFDFGMEFFEVFNCTGLPIDEFAAHQALKLSFFKLGQS